MSDTNRNITPDGVIVRRAGDEAFGALGVQVSVLARGAETNNAWSLLEYVSPSGGPAPPPHWHKVAREAFYILEGSLQFEIDERVIDAPTGTLVVVPPRTDSQMAKRGTHCRALSGDVLPRRIRGLLSGTLCVGQQRTVVAAKRHEPHGSTQR
jgi:mannose-6-phosphate isomerase-like protein (cupin superfamily)